MPNKQNLQLIIRHSERIIFEGDVHAISSYNERGVFDILFEHENFISLISKTCVIHNLDGTKKEIKIDEGILSAHENKVNIYLGIIGK